MRDRYVGGVGDFVKYGLLRATGEGKRLGVAWHLYTDERRAPHGEIER